MSQIQGDYQLSSTVDDSTLPNAEIVPVGESSDSKTEDPPQSEKLPEDKHVPIRVWAVLLISCFGVFMASVSTSALVIAFPTLLADLDMSLNTIMWVLLILLLMIGAVVPTAGKLGDIVSQALIYKIGYCVFVIGSLGAGFVQKKNQGYDLIACRIVIGFGAALLFTNSSAILTNAFAPYNKVGLSQGIFQLSSAMGIVLGPLIGGAFAESDWRWIFWFNVPSGGFFAIASFFVVQDKVKPISKSMKEHAQSFDFIGSIFSSFGLVLILIAMIQGVAPDATLSTTGALVGLIVSGSFCGLIFIIDQFYAKDPLIPPSIFYDRIYFTTTTAATFMAFVRNSITYNMIFFLQGPYGEDPLKAGTDLIPYGIGIMAAGFSSGVLADKLGMRNMIMCGPLITLAACAGLSTMDQNTNHATIEGLLFLAGFGIGIFQSPNATGNMLSVDASKRGVAAAVSMMTMTFCMMVGIVLTFSFVLNSMSAAQLYGLFIYGGGSGDFPVRKCLDALASDYYIVIAFCACASFCGFSLPSDMNQILKARHSPAPVGSSSKALIEEDEEVEIEKIESVKEEGKASDLSAGTYAKVAIAPDSDENEQGDIEMATLKPMSDSEV
eukprot:gene5945-6392_t